MSSVQFLFSFLFSSGTFTDWISKEEDLEHRLCVWGGNSRSLHGPIYERVRFPYFLSLMRGRVMRSASAECRERDS